jgi:hypothetical protein
MNEILKLQSEVLGGPKLTEEERIIARDILLKNQLSIFKTEIAESPKVEKHTENTLK